MFETIKKPKQKFRCFIKQQDILFPTTNKQDLNLMLDNDCCYKEIKDKLTIKHINDLSQIKDRRNFYIIRLYFNGYHHSVLFSKKDKKIYDSWNYRVGDGIKSKNFYSNELLEAYNKKYFVDLKITQSERCGLCDFFAISYYDCLKNNVFRKRETDDIFKKINSTKDFESILISRYPLLKNNKENIIIMR